MFVSYIGPSSGRILSKEVPAARTPRPEGSIRVNSKSVWLVRYLRNKFPLFDNDEWVPVSTTHRRAVCDRAMRLIERAQHAAQAHPEQRCSDLPARPAPTNKELEVEYTASRQVKMIRLQFNFFPRRFELGGRTLNVTGVLRSDTHGRSFIFRVRCDDGREYVLEHKIEQATPHVFASPEIAVAWGFERGAFKALEHARNAYNKLKREENPKDAVEMASLWTAAVMRRLQQPGMFNGDHAEEEGA